MYKQFTTTPQNTLFSRLEEQLDRKHPLYILSNKVHWDVFETEFSRHYHAKKGRPCKSIRLMVGLLILKHFMELVGRKRCLAMDRECLLSVLLWHECVFNIAPMRGK